LWRYQVIRDAIDPGLTAKQRGALVRALAAQSHPGPGGGAVRVSRETLDRWVKAWRTGGFEALAPKGRAAHARTPREVLDLAASLKAERPERTCAQVRRIIVRATGDAPSESTLLRHFRTLGLPGAHREAHGRFEADFCNEIWVGDALHGPVIGGRKAYLFAFLDDRSRFVVAARWAHSEDHARLAIALRPALGAWGIPDAVYVDNGSAFKDAQLARACARLGIRLIHSAPARPQGRGKIERFFNTVTSQFLAEVAPAAPGAPGPAGSPVASLAQLNELFRAWVERVYHQSVNDTTAQTPLQRWNDAWAKAAPRRAPAGEIAEAFLWSAARTVTANATIQLFNNTYQVDPALAGRKVEAVYDPFDMSKPLAIRHRDQDAGTGDLLTITRHVHPKAARADRDEPHLPGGAGSAATGIDYLRLIAADHTAAIAADGIDYTALAEPADPAGTGTDGQLPGQRGLW
jgi:putative transposase